MGRDIDNKRKLNHEWYLRVKDTPEYKHKKRQWYLQHRDEILRKKRDANALKPKQQRQTQEETRAKRKIWEQKHKQERNQKMKIWRQANLLKQRAYARNYFHKRISTKMRYSRLRNDAHARNIELLLTFEQFHTIIQSPCHYCGDNQNRRGLDRTDSDIGYTHTNVVACCKTCNYMKRSMSLLDFIAHIKRIASNV